MMCGVLFWVSFYKIIFPHVAGNGSVALGSEGGTMGCDREAAAAPCTFGTV
jgi:hypothetical protein